MTTNHSLPVGLQIGADVDFSMEELAETWALAADASPLGAAPDPARIETMRRTLIEHSRALRLVPRRYYWAVAASVVLLICAGVFTLSRPIQLTATAALDAELPDGSSVALSAESELRYHRRFGRAHRNLAMEGAALFDVHTSPIPFVVAIRDVTVTAEGTRFSVDATDQGTTVYVAEGTVAVASQGDTRRLHAGEGVRVEVGTGNFSALAVPGQTSTELFIHIKQPLGVMFDAVEDRFDIEIIAEESIRQHVHNFKHEVTTVETLISDLCRSVTSMTLRYRSTAAGFEILEE